MGKCKHNKAHRFHENSPLYCPDCKYYLEYIVVGNKVVLEKLRMEGEKGNDSNHRP